VTALLLSGTILTAQQRNSPLTNNDVVKMVKSGLPEATIVNTIATSDTQFDLSSAGLQALSQSGVSSKVVRAMLAAESKKKDAARTRLHRSHSRHTPQRHPHEELFM
jgi:hypothetical protein